MKRMLMAVRLKRRILAKWAMDDRMMTSLADSRQTLTQPLRPLNFSCSISTSESGAFQFSKWIVVLNLFFLQCRLYPYVLPLSLFQPCLELAQANYLMRGRIWLWSVKICNKRGATYFFFMSCLNTWFGLMQSLADEILVVFFRKIVIRVT